MITACKHRGLRDPSCLFILDKGCVDLWSTETGGEPILHYQCPGRIQALVLSPDSPVLASVTGQNIRVDRADDCGYWRTLCQAQLPKTVSLSPRMYHMLHMDVLLC